MVEHQSDNRGPRSMREIEHQQDLGSQQLFSQMIDRMRKADLQELPNLAGHINHDGRTTYGLEVMMPQGFYAAPEVLESYRSIGQGFPDRTAFANQPILRIGREDSRRKVFFGALNLQWFNGYREQLPVAVKPFVGAALGATAMHEIAMYQHLKTEGHDTLDVVGALSIDHPDPRKKTTYMLTKFQPNLLTMDGIQWADLSPEETSDQLNTALDTMAWLHEHMLFHGDFEFKNIGVSMVKGRISILDVEHMVSARHVLEHVGENPASIEVIRRLMSREFTDLTRSHHKFILNAHEETRGLSDVERFEIEMQNLYFPYYERIAHMHGAAQVVLTAAFNNMLTQKYREATGVM